jgi:NTP-dependent ternary conflict system VMAP-like protein/effector-associated domain 2 (EAD2)-containing protein/trypsin-like peptidase
MEPMLSSGTWHARVLRPDGTVCGAGVLLTDRHVLTCAHVIAAALNCDPRGPRPDGLVQVDFPASPDRAARQARIAADGWANQRQDEGGDLAVMVIDGTPVRGVFPPRLARCGTPGRRNVRVFGHPQGFPGGLWAVGQLIGAGGQSSEWVQLDGQSSGAQIVPGYSGAGVVDDETEAVIGCVVASVNWSGKSPVPGIAWMIPLETVALYWPPLAPFLEDIGADQGTDVRPAEHLADEQQLAVRLFALALIRDRRTRDLCIDRMRRRLRQPMPLSRHEDDFEDVRALARACLRVPGLMAELLAILGQAAGGAPELVELERLAASLIPVPVLQRDERNELYALLGRVRLEGMEVLYREAVGEFGKPLRSRPGDLPAIVQQLEDASYGPQGVPPLLHFLRGAADRLTPSAGRELRDWLTGVARRLDIAEVRITAPESRAGGDPAADGDRHYLITDLTQDLLDPERYRVTIWFQAGGQEQVIGGGDDELVRLGDVPQQLDAALTTLSPDLIGNRHSQMYEFILPRHLLGYPVDQWRIGPAGLSYRFSMTAPVIVRSQDRLRDQRMQHYWHSKWRWLRAHGGHAGPEAVHWVDNRRPIVAEGVLALLVGDDPPVCVVFRQPPEPGSEQGEDAVMAALVGGIPAMIWCRDPDTAEPVRAEIERLLADGGLAELPERVRLLRQQAVQAGSPDGHPGLSLTLLWDAADRIPRAYRDQQRTDGRMLP